MARYYIAVIILNIVFCAFLFLKFKKAGFSIRSFFFMCIVSIFTSLCFPFLVSYVSLYVAILIGLGLLYLGSYFAAKIHNEYTIVASLDKIMDVITANESAISKDLEGNTQLLTKIDTVQAQSEEFEVQGLDKPNERIEDRIPETEVLPLKAEEEPQELGTITEKADSDVNQFNQVDHTISTSETEQTEHIDQTVTIVNKQKFNKKNKRKSKKDKKRKNQYQNDQSQKIEKVESPVESQPKQEPAILDNKELCDSFVMKGFDAKMSGDIQLAVRLFSSACDLHPPFDLAKMLYEDIFAMYREIGQYQKAIDTLEQFLKQQSANISDAELQEIKTELKFTEYLRDMLARANTPFLPYSKVPALIRVSVEEKVNNWRKESF